MAETRCARCVGPLHGESYHSVRLLACPTGHGALLTKDARRTLTVSARATLEHALETPGEERLACGACGRTAHVVVAHRHGDDIELDACGHCGAVWFDAGEVARLHHLPPKNAGAADAGPPRGAMGLQGSGAGAHMGFVAIEGIGSLIGGLLEGW